MKRQHPVNILEDISGYFWLLLLPLIRGVVTYRAGFSDWISGVWFDLAVLFLIFLLAFLRWYFFGYWLTDDGIHIRSGIVLRRDFTLAYRSFSALSIVSPYLYRPIKAVHLYADSNAGNEWKYDFSLTLSAKAADELSIRASSLEDGKADNHFCSGGWYIAVLSFVSSKPVTGILFAATFISHGAALLGEQFQTEFFQRLSVLSKVIAPGLSPAGIFLSLSLLIGWLISFIRNFTRTSRFCVKRQGQIILFDSGLLRRFHHFVSVKETNLVETRQSIVTRLLRVHSLFLHCAGYGKKHSELAVLFPAARAERIEEILNTIVPEWHLSNRTVAPKGLGILAFILPPAWLILLILAATITAVHFFPAFEPFLWFVGFMLELPILWWLAVRIISFFHTGISYDDGIFTLRFSKGYGFRTVAVHRDRIVKVTYHRAAFPRDAKGCTLEVETRSEGHQRHKILALPFDETRQLFEFVYKSNETEEPIC